MGKLHARVYSQIPGVKLTGVFDAQPGTADSVAQQYGGRAFADLDEMLSQVKAVSIAVPTIHHLAIAEKCLARRVPCLIEKPLAKTPAEARRIVELSKQNNTTVQVGHIERFNPAFRAMGNLEIKPRFIEVMRISPLTFRSIDVGVVLDMMIHDIDIVLKLAASLVTKIDAVGVSVISGAGENSSSPPVEDICNARLTFANGVVANMTASRLSLKTERKLRVFCADAYVSLDYAKKYGIVARRSGNLDAIRSAVERIRSGEVQDLAELNFADLVHIEELQIDDVEPLRAQLDSFVESITNGTHPAVTAEEGMAAVETAAKIVEAMGAVTLG
jgi:predicted dehydrogenase